MERLHRTTSTHSLTLKSLLLENKQLRAENIGLKKRLAEQEKELKDGPAGARHDVMLERIATLTREIEFLKQKDCTSDDKRSGHQLPSQQCSGTDPFTELLGCYLRRHEQNLTDLPEEAAPAMGNEEVTLLHQTGQAARRRRSRTQSVSSRRNSPGGQIRKLKRSNTCREHERKLYRQSLYEVEEDTEVHLRPRTHVRYSAPPNFFNIPTGNNFKEVTFAVAETPVSQSTNQCASQCAS